MNGEQYFFIPGLFNSSFFLIALSINYFNKINFWYLLENSDYKIFRKIKLTQDLFLLAIATLLYSITIISFLISLLVWEVDIARVEWFYILVVQFWYLMGMAFFYKLILSYSNKISALFILYSLPLLINLINTFFIKLLDVNVILYQPLALINDSHLIYSIGVGTPVFYLLSKLFHRKYYW